MLPGSRMTLGLLSPVDDDGKFTDECGLDELVGQHVFKTNKRITEILEEGGNLLGSELYDHQYPALLAFEDTDYFPGR